MGSADPQNRVEGGRVDDSGLEKQKCHEIESAYHEHEHFESVTDFSEASQAPSVVLDAIKPSPTIRPIPADDVGLRCLPIRNICVAGLVLALAFALSALSLGAYLVHAGAQSPPAWLLGTCAWTGYDYSAWIDPGEDVYLSGRWPFVVSNAATTILPLAASYFVTFLLDTTSRIHSTSLRWALYREGRLEFHSNPRLLSASKTHGPNRWYVNVIGVLAISFAYGALSILFARVHVMGYSGADYLPLPDKPYHGPQYGIDINGWALTILGAAMLLQGAIATWSLLDRANLIQTWSSHVVTTIQVISLKLAPSLSPASTLRSNDLYAEEKRKTTVEVAERCRRAATEGPRLTRQASAREVVPVVRRITLVLWLMFAVSILCVIVVSALARFLYPSMISTSRAYVANYTEDGATAQGYWSGFGQVYFPIATRLAATQNRDWLGVIIQTCFLAPITLCLHYTETLADVLGDEIQWRDAMSSESPPPVAGRLHRRLARAIRHRVPVWLACNLPRWPAFVLFLVKGLTQWIFSSVLNVGLIAYIALLPLVALSVILLAFAGGAEVLSRYRPKGALRSTYGNLVLCSAYYGQV